GPIRNLSIELRGAWGSLDKERPRRRRRGRAVPLDSPAGVLPWVPQRARLLHDVCQQHANGRARRAVDIMITRRIVTGQRKDGTGVIVGDMVLEPTVYPSGN